jgi:hypothetical protein
MCLCLFCSGFVSSRAVLEGVFATNTPNTARAPRGEVSASAAGFIGDLVERLLGIAKGGER